MPQLLLQFNFPNTLRHVLVNLKQEIRSFCTPPSGTFMKRQILMVCDGFYLFISLFHTADLDDPVTRIPGDMKHWKMPSMDNWHVAQHSPSKKAGTNEIKVHWGESATMETWYVKRQSTHRKHADAISRLTNTPTRSDLPFHKLKKKVTLQIHHQK